MGNEKTVEELIQRAEEQFQNTKCWFAMGNDQKKINALKKALKAIGFAFVIKPHDLVVLECFEKINKEFFKFFDEKCQEKNEEKINFLREIVNYFVDLKLSEDPGLFFLKIFCHLNSELKALEELNVSDPLLLKKISLNYFDQVFCFLDKNIQLNGYKKKKNDLFPARGFRLQQLSQENLDQSNEFRCELLESALSDFKTYWNKVDENEKNKAYVVIRNVSYLLIDLSSEEKKISYLQSCLAYLEFLKSNLNFRSFYFTNRYTINFKLIKLNTKKQTKKICQEECFKSLEELLNLNLDKNKKIEIQVLDFILKFFFDMVEFSSERSLNIFSLTIDKCINFLKYNYNDDVFFSILKAFENLNKVSSKYGVKLQKDLFSKILFAFIFIIDENKEKKHVVSLGFENVFNKIDRSVFALLDENPSKLCMLMISVHNLSTNLVGEELKRNWLDCSFNYFSEKIKNDPKDKGFFSYYINSGFQLSDFLDENEKKKFLEELLLKVINFDGLLNCFEDSEMLLYYANIQWQLARQSTSEKTSQRVFLKNASLAFSELVEKNPKNWDALNSCAWVYYECSLFVENFEEKRLLLRKSLNCLKEFLGGALCGFSQIQLLLNVHFQLLDMLLTENKTNEAISQLNKIIEGFSDFLKNKPLEKSFVLNAKDFFNQQCTHRYSSYLGNIQEKLQLLNDDPLSEAEDNSHNLKEDEDVMIIDNPDVLIRNSLLPPPGARGINNNNNNSAFLQK